VSNGAEGWSNVDVADYLWTCLWFYEGKLIHPTSISDIKPFFQTLGRHIYQVSMLGVACGPC
jgi:hypothetical protein